MFQWKSSGQPVQVTPASLNLPRFTLSTYNVDYCNSKTNTGEYSCILVNLIFRREFSYYLIQIYIPCCMLVIVSWVSFWLDPNAIPARVSLGVTTLLTMATQISGINASLPPVSYTKAIDVWTGSCLTFVFGAVFEFALVNYASRSDAHRAANKKKKQQAASFAQRISDLEQQEIGFDGEDSFDIASLPFDKIEVRIRPPVSYPIITRAFDCSHLCVAWRSWRTNCANARSTPASNDRTAARGGLTVSPPGPSESMSSLASSFPSSSPCLTPCIGLRTSSGTTSKKFDTRSI